MFRALGDDGRLTCERLEHVIEQLIEILDENDEFSSIELEADYSSDSWSAGPVIAHASNLEPELGSTEATAESDQTIGLRAGAITARRESTPTANHSLHLSKITIINKDGR